MTTFKILVNSTLSTPGAKWLGLDVKNYYLGTPMDNYEYMFIPIIQIPQEFESTITSYTTLYTKAKSTWKFAVVCTAFPRQESSPKNNSSVSLAGMALPLFPTHPDYGIINGGQSPSSWSLTILASNTLAKNMLTTSSNASATITKKSKSTGLANASVAST